MRRQGILVAADLARQLGQLEVGLRQRPPRSDVGILVEQGAQPAVELRRRFQEPVAQLLEFLLLEQEVLTHAGVKRLDGLDREVVAGLDLGIGGSEGAVLVREGEIGPGLHRQHRRQTDDPRQHGRRRCGHPGAMPCQPAHQLPRPRLGISRDRLVGHPPLHILGQGPARRVTVARPVRHRLQADGFQGHVQGRFELSGRDEVTPLHLAEDLAEILALERRLPGQKAIQGGAERVDVGAGREPIEIATRLLGAHVGRRAHGSAGHGFRRSAR